MRPYSPYNRSSVETGKNVEPFYEFIAFHIFGIQSVFTSTLWVFIYSLTKFWMASEISLSNFANTYGVVLLSFKVCRVRSVVNHQRSWYCARRLSDFTSNVNTNTLKKIEKDIETRKGKLRYHNEKWGVLATMGEGGKWRCPRSIGIVCRVNR